MLLVGNTQNELDDTEAHSDLARGDVVEEGLSLRGKARTVDHPVTHLATAPLCEACVRGNMTRKRAHTKKPDDNTAVPTTRGDQVAADHLVANRIVSHGINRSAYAAVFWGIGTRYVDSYPGGDKRAAEARPALQVLIGPRQSVMSFQCDVAHDVGFINADDHPAAVTVALITAVVALASRAATTSFRRSAAPALARSRGRRPRLALAGYLPATLPTPRAPHPALPTWHTRSHHPHTHTHTRPLRQAVGRLGQGRP